MIRSAEEHDILVLELASKILPLLREPEAGVVLSALLTIVGAVLHKHMQSCTDDSTPVWAHVMVPLIGVALFDIAHEGEHAEMRES